MRLLAVSQAVLSTDTERMDLGVDRVCLHAHLPKDKFKSGELGKIFPRPKERNEDRPYLVGQRYHNEAGRVCRFELSRFPYRSGHDLKITFNPNTLVMGHNTDIGNADVFFLSLRKVQALLHGLELPLRVASLGLLEIHLTRDILFHCEVAGGNRNSEMEAEMRVVQDVLRLLSWQVPPYARRVKAYNNSKKKTVEDELLEEGLVGGSKSREWMIYDKTLKCQIDDVECLPQYGRILRVEWKLKKNKQIQKHLGVVEAGQLDAILPPYDNVIERIFDQELQAAHFRIFKPYGQRMPRIRPELLTALQRNSTTEAQQALLHRLGQKDRIARRDVDLFVGVLSQIGAHEVRSLVCNLYGIGVGSASPKRKLYDECCEMIARLRQHSAWDTQTSYSQKQEEAKYWLCRLGRNG